MLTWSFFFYLLIAFIVLILLFCRKDIVLYLDNVLGEKKEHVVKVLRKKLICETGDKELSYITIGVMRVFPQVDRTFYLLDVLIENSVWEVGVTETTFGKISEGKMVKITYRQGKWTGEIYPGKITAMLE